MTPMKRTLALAVLVLTAIPATAKEVVPIIEDDFARAVAQARTKNVPIFVNAWAPW